MRVEVTASDVIQRWPQVRQCKRRETCSADSEIGLDKDGFIEDAKGSGRGGSWCKTPEASATRGRNDEAAILASAGTLIRCG